MLMLKIRILMPWSMEKEMMITAFTLGDPLIIRDSPDFETKPSYSIRLKTTDSGGLFEKGVKI